MERKWAKEGREGFRGGAAGCFKGFSRRNGGLPEKLGKITVLVGVIHLGRIVKRTGNLWD